MKRIFSLLYILIVSTILLLTSCKSTHGGGGCPGHGGYSTDNYTVETVHYHS